MVLTRKCSLVCFFASLNHVIITIIIKHIYNKNLRFANNIQIFASPEGQKWQKSFSGSERTINRKIHRGLDLTTAVLKKKQHIIDFNVGSVVCLYVVDTRVSAQAVARHLCSGDFTSENRCCHLPWYQFCVHFRWIKSQSTMEIINNQQSLLQNIG